MDSTENREIIEHSRSQDIEDIFCLFGFVNYPISSSEDEDATDDHSEVIANEHIQDNLLGLKQ